MDPSSIIGAPTLSSYDLYMDLYLGSMWFQCMVAGTTATQPLIEEGLAESATRWRDDVVGDCEEERGAGGATDGEKLVSVTADGRGVLVCPFIHLHTIQELGWCFVLQSQTIVHTDNDWRCVFGNGATH